MGLRWIAMAVGAALVLVERRDVRAEVGDQEAWRVGPELPRHTEVGLFFVRLVTLTAGRDR